MIRRMILCWTSALVCLTALSASGDELEQLLFDEPDVLEVQRAAARFAGCDPESLQRLERDVRALRPVPDTRARMLKEQRVRLDKRDEVLARVTDLYYERLRARTRLDRGAELSPDEHLELQLAAEEAGSRLDALTGGEFSRLVEERREEAERARVGFRPRGDGGSDARGRWQDD